MSNRGFSAVEEPIGGSMLIEASAGTGKTYSIAILALRILLQKSRINLDEILMVTFTNAAVAELEERIRLFVRTAHKYMEGKKELKSDNDIRKVIETSEVDQDELRQRLSDAVQRLDRLSVMTIHSFCQQTIEEFTFETGQSFDFEIISDDSDLLIGQANRFIREEINILDPESRKKLNKDLSFKKLPELLSKHLKGMVFIDGIDNSDNTELESLEDQLADARKKLEEFVKEKFPQIIEKGLNKPIHTAAEHGDVDEFITKYHDQAKKKEPAKFFLENYAFMSEEFMNHFLAHKEIEEALKKEREEVVKRDKRLALNQYYMNFFRRAEENLEKIKARKAYISYDDQIRTIHRVRDLTLLNRKLRNKYKAVFVDEFQDTDSYQYEIFHKLFQDGFEADEKKPMVFYIGDPKQSIYAWRGADLDTYKEAGKNVDRKPGEMKYNYRSTEKMLDALNLALDPGGNFDLFDDDEIIYRPVEAGNNSLGAMKDRGREVVPVTVWRFRDDDERSSFRAIANEIRRLIKEDSEANIKGEQIKPEDIGVLVRDNREAKLIKRMLERYNIPAIKRDGKKVFESDEAGMIRYLIEAVLLPSHGSIVRALLSPWFGFSMDTIQEIRDEEHLEIFRALGSTLKEEGIYYMISSFLDKYKVRSRCMDELKGQRVLTNINHIAEILHRTERKTSCTPEELMSWMDRAMDNDEEEFEQRIESDENAVQISTIHKAKGLEYKIVFAPGLCMIPKYTRLYRKNANDFKKDGTYYFTFDYPSLSEEDKKLHDKQKEQENMRLIYVSLTRPVYKLYISYMQKTFWNDIKKSSMDDLFTAWEGLNTDLMEIEDFTEQMVPYPEIEKSPDDQKIEFHTLPLADCTIKNKFGIHSFSALSRPHHSAPFEKVELGDPEDFNQFIFQDMGRGAEVGTALHAIFEYLEFDRPDTWGKSLENTGRIYPGIIREEHHGHFLSMVRHTLHSKIVFGEEEVHLHRINSDRMLPEMAFYFSIDSVNRQVLDEIMEEEADLGGESDMAGLMTGFIDLVFEQNGKYYILDWKSNFLGNDVGMYDNAGLSRAMIDSNYNLQYMIYTVALKRYLETRITGFDYEKHFGGVIYLFLRGTRENKETGVFATKPDKEMLKKLDNSLSHEKR